MPLTTLHYFVLTLCKLQLREIIERSSTQPAWARSHLQQSLDSVNGSEDETMKKFRDNRQVGQKLLDRARVEVEKMSAAKHEDAQQCQAEDLLKQLTHTVDGLLPHVLPMPASWKPRIVHEADNGSGLVHPAGSPGPMQVRCDVERELELHHVPDRAEVEPARCQVGAQTQLKRRPTTTTTATSTSLCGSRE